MNCRESGGLEILRIDRNETFAAANRDDLGAERPEKFNQKVAADRRMLIDGDPFAGEGGIAKELPIPALVSEGSRVRLRGKLGVAGFEHAVFVKQGFGKRLVVQALADAPDELADGPFLLFAKFSLGRIEFVAIQLEGDMAAGYHDARPVFEEGVMGESGGRDAA